MFNDASFAGNNDLSSQLGYVILLADKNDYCQIIHWSSHKLKRVTRSVLGSKVMKFADGFDRAYAIKAEIQIMTNTKIPLRMYTDSLSMFDILTKATMPTGKV